MFVSTLRRQVEAIRAVLSEMDPESLNGPEAAEAVSVFVDLERAAAAGKAICARRVQQAGTYAETGHRDAADWLAQMAGESKGEALCALRTAHQLETLAPLREAFVSGELSAAQVRTIAGAGSVAPESVPALMEAARDESLKALRDRAERARSVALSAHDQASRDAAAHAGRFLRTWRGIDGGVRGEFSLGTSDWGRCLGRLEARADTYFKRALASGTHEGHAQYLADALVDLVLGARTDGREGPRARVLVRVDAAALRRGRLGPGEHCEIAGVGTVSVAVARELLGDSLFNVVVTDAHDVKTVSGTKRTIPTSVRIALHQRDPSCVVPGCDAVLGLEIDHWLTDYSDGGPTSLDNLARVCKVHHDMHTHKGWRLSGGPGEWRWVGPAPDDDPEPPEVARRSSRRAPAVRSSQGILPSRSIRGVVPLLR